MELKAILISNDFKCSKCGKRVPQIVLSPKKATLLCNLCDEPLFLKTYCENLLSEEEKNLRKLEVTENQIKLLIEVIRKRVKGRAFEVVQINDYWIEKTNNEYSFGNTRQTDPTSPVQIDPS